MCFAWSEHDRGRPVGVDRARRRGLRKWPASLDAAADRAAGGADQGWGASPRRRVRQRRARIVRAATRGVVRGGDRHEARRHRRDPTQRRAQWHGRAGEGDAWLRSRRSRTRSTSSWRTSAGRRSSSSRPSSSQRVSPGGWLAVSGISSSQCSLVAGFLRPLVELERRTSGEWSALVLTRSG